MTTEANKPNSLTTKEGDVSGTIFSRSELLLGREMMEELQRVKVIILGIGGVGSWCAESLIRTGVKHLTIVDSDCISITNVNRQLMATTLTVGEVKVEAMRRRLMEINPQAEITAMRRTYSEEANASFHLEDYDYIIDCIDSLKDKIHLLMNATRSGNAKVFSSMGAALKIDPTQVRVAEFWKVRGCTLGAAMRKRMRRHKLTLERPVQCVYSEELLENRGYDALAEHVAAELEQTSKAQINGSLSHITAIYGFTLAGLVMKDIYGTE